MDKIEWICKPHTNSNKQIVWKCNPRTKNTEYFQGTTDSVRIGTNYTNSGNTPTGILLPGDSGTVTQISGPNILIVANNNPTLMYWYKTTDLFPPPPPPPPPPPSNYPGNPLSYVQSNEIQTYNNNQQIELKFFKMIKFIFFLMI